MDHFPGVSYIKTPETGKKLLMVLSMPIG